MKKYSVLVSLMLLLASCTQNTQLSIAPDVASWAFDADGGSFDVVIFTNGIWTATCEDSTVVFTPASGDYTTPMHVTVGKNEEMYTKSIRIALSSKIDAISRSSRIVITQTCNPFIFCEEAEKTIGPEGGAVRFPVNADHAWKVVETALDGVAFPLTVDPSEHGANSVDVAVWIPENESGRERTFTVTLALEQDPSVNVVLTVTQKN